ncbi:DUF1684 domain-containing protein [Tellurirhabdus bombi]|uniref:DUF1684 domain-containing protein n=1 Tax=Tellurirhabdus bombi TaxID=2907205 RepID=UPI001F486B69|nr:DUF1684 domain-containing protein [Tellurirhabdus bombi]
MLFPRLFFLLCMGLSTTSFGQTSYAKDIERHRADYKAEFLKDPKSPLKTKKAVAALRFFEPDSSYRVTATVQRTTQAEPFDMLTYDGKKQPYVSYAVLTFTLAGQPQKLTLYRSLRLAQLPQYRDYVFIPFKDQTNGSQTYGGGRYLDLRLGAIQDGKLIIDFNKAYNPYCAYDEGYSCPIPPQENHLKTPILAGEKAYGKK